MLCMLTFKYSATFLTARGQKNKPLTITQWIFLDLKNEHNNDLICDLNNDINIKNAIKYTYA